MQTKGRISVHFRESGRRWHVRILIPVELAYMTGFKQGVRFNASRKDNTLVIRECDSGQFRFPRATGSREPSHAIEVSTNTFGFLPARRGHHKVDMRTDGSDIEITLPESIIDRPHDSSPPETVKKAESRNWVSISAGLRKELGTEPVASVVVEAARRGERVLPMSVSGMVERMKSSGAQLHQLGPQLFCYNGRTVNISDLQEEFNSTFRDNRVDTTVLVLRQQ